MPVVSRAHICIFLVFAYFILRIYYHGWRIFNFMENAVVLFSGGQDSSTCLAWALHKFDNVETVGFSYGQHHDIELEARARLLKVFAASHANLGQDHLLSTNILTEIGGSSLLNGSQTTILPNGLPSSFVPGRNLFFLVCASALAYRLNSRHIVAGVCETDFSGYPDCRDIAIKASNVAINLCMDANLVLHTPLMWLTKAQTWRLAEELGGDSLVAIIRKESHTCYQGDHHTLHDWGFGCGDCPACVLRAKGWREYRAQKQAS